MKQIYLTALALLSLAVAFSQGKNDSSATTDRPVPEPKMFTSEHQINLQGTTINYQVMSGEMHLKNDKGEPAASLWSTSYLAKGVNDPSRRPVIFIFNGGPGSASVWLHMGLFGPQLVQVNSEASEDDGGAPYPLRTNEGCLLDLADLVFIDPVGTGFSQVFGKGKNEDYWGLNEDAASIAQFIRLWITRHQRWNAPKFIAGESFGTTRAAAVAEALEGSGQNVALNGLILISQALDYTGSTPVHDNLVAYITYLPTMAATAWYHKKAGQGKTLEAFVQECREFAYDEYSSALFRGALLNEEQKNTIAEKLAYFTGLDKTYILRSDLRVLAPRFRKELLRAEGKVVGGLDSRYTIEEPDQVAERPTLGDAASSSISSAYTAALNHYFATALEVKMDRPYKTSNGSVGRSWNWRPVSKNAYWEPSYVNVSRRLSNALRRNKDLKVMVANGYYDLITPFFDAEYTFSRHGIDQGRISMKYYEAGHMMYVHEEDLKALNRDMRAFLKEQL
jgi:carboxypeptidase C (cathepsin A)